MADELFGLPIRIENAGKPGEPITFEFGVHCYFCARPATDLELMLDGKTVGKICEKCAHDLGVGELVDERSTGRGTGR